MRIARTAFLLATAGLGLAATALPASALSHLTARASARIPVHTGPHDWSPVIDKLEKNERVHLARCTYESEWCLVVQLDGGPSGWVEGSWLVGSPAKVEVTPFKFSFDPMDPLDLFPHHHN